MNKVNILLTLNSYKIFFEKKVEFPLNIKK